MLVALLIAAYVVIAGIVCEIVMGGIDFDDPDESFVNILVAMFWPVALGIAFASVAFTGVGYVVLLPGRLVGKYVVDPLIERWSR